MIGNLVVILRRGSELVALGFALSFYFFGHFTETCRNKHFTPLAAPIFSPAAFPSALGKRSFRW